MKVQKAYILQLSPNLGESHPVPAQAHSIHKIAKGRATKVPSLENYISCTCRSVRLKSSFALKELSLPTT